MGVASALLVVPLAKGSTAVVHAGAAQSAQTPDQQLVVALTTVRNTARAAATSLAKPSKPRVAAAKNEIRRSAAGVTIAGKAARGAVGALDIPSVRAALARAASLLQKARLDVAGERYGPARTKLSRAADLADDALGDFGVPLAKEFAGLCRQPRLRIPTRVRQLLRALGEGRQRDHGGRRSAPPTGRPPTSASEAPSPTRPSACRSRG